MQAIANLFGLFVELMRPMLTPFANWIAPTLNPFIERVGAINVLFLSSLAAWLLIILAIALIIMRLRRMMLEAVGVYAHWRTLREAEAVRREAESVAEDRRITADCVGTGMAPSLMFPNDVGSISGIFFTVCANGGVAPVVEDSFHDLECAHPCKEHPECELAH